jgi:hypothetical protein
MRKLAYGIGGLVIVVVVAASGLQRAKAVVATSPRIGNTPIALTDEVSERQMALQSELILTGKCVGTRSAWVGRNLFTLATISVGEVIKGHATETVTVAVPGGIDLSRKVPVSMRYEGAPRILAQEELFLFLTRQPEIPMGYVVTGYSQGKFSVAEDEQGQKHVSRDLTKMQLRTGAGIARGKVQKTSLAEFKERIMGFLRQQ